jgi:hypothetical protein
MSRISEAKAQEEGQLISGVSSAVRFMTRLSNDAPSFLPEMPIK